MDKVISSVPIASHEKDKSLIAILMRRHEDYAELSNLWAMYQATFVGGKDMLPYLIQHDREHDESFKARKKRAFYFNYVRQIIDLFVSYLFRKDISRESDLPEILRFWDNADGTSEGIEHPITPLLKEAVLLYLLFGKAAVVVDIPSSEEEVKTEKDRKDANLYPYMYIIKPQNITDWQYGEDGSLEWVRIEESVPTPVSALGGRNQSKRFKYTTWTRTSWMIHIIESNNQGQYKLVKKPEEHSHHVGRVPVVIIQKTDNFNFGSSSGESLVKDISISNIALFNLSSITGEEFYNHALNILVMQRGNQEDDDTEVVLSNKNVLEYDGQSPPHFLAPSSVPVESLQGFLGKIESEMKRMSRLGSTDSSLSGAPNNQTSGLAQAFSFSDSNQALADTALLFEEVERKIVTFVALWLNLNLKDKLSSTKIDYPSDFGIDLFDDELQTVNTAVDTIPSKTFAKVLKKRTAKKFLTKETDETIEAVNKEIDAAIESLTNQPTGGNPDSEELNSKDNLPGEENDGTHDQEDKRESKKEKKPEGAEEAS